MKHFKLMKGMLACLLSLALVFSCFTTVGAKAEGTESESGESTGGAGTESESGESTGGAGTESGSAESTSGAETTNKITATYNAETDKVDFVGEKAGTVYYAIVKKTGSKIGTKFASVTLDKDKKASIVLDSTDGGVKVDPTKDLYLWVGGEEPDAKKTYKPVLTVNATAYKKLVVTFNFSAAESASGEDIVKVTTKVGKTEKTLDVADISYRYSKDGTSFGDTWTNASSISGGTLATAVKDAAEGKATFEFRTNAIAASGESTAQRGSKLAKVTVKKAAKAPKIKVDYAKGIVAIKNGYDYAVKSESGAPTTSGSGDWTTILPVKKGGAADNEEIATNSYVPAAKVTTETKTSFTTKKISAISIEDLFAKVDSNAEKIYVYVRKSATAKAAPSDYAMVELKKPAAAPEFKEVKADGERKNATKPWTYALVASDTLSGGDYEYLIVKKDDVLSGENAIDLSAAKWSKLTAKGIVVGKAKSKISKTVTNILKADGNFDILIRKAAVKKGEDAAFASDYVRTSVSAPVNSGSGEDTTSKITWAPKNGVNTPSGSGE